MTRATKFDVEEKMAKSIRANLYNTIPTFGGISRLFAIYNSVFMQGGVSVMDVVG